MDIPTILANAVPIVAPSVVAMAIDGRNTLVQHAAGVRRLGDSAPMTLDNVVWIASMTKAITSIAAMHLVKQGRVNLRQPLAQSFPTRRAGIGSGLVAALDQPLVFDPGKR